MNKNRLALTGDKDDGSSFFKFFHLNARAYILMAGDSLARASNSTGDWNNALKSVR